MHVKVVQICALAVPAGASGDLRFFLGFYAKHLMLGTSHFTVETHWASCDFT